MLFSQELSSSQCAMAAGVTATLAIGVTTTYLICRKRNAVIGAVHRGPYPTANSGFAVRTLSRLLTERSRKVIEATWYPNTPFRSVAIGRSDNNGHAISGSCRDAARKMIRAAVLSQGYQIVELSPAGITSKLNAANIHQHYAAGDLSTPIETPLTIPEKSVILAIDCDYYTDPTFLLSYGVPVILYTFNPVAVSGRDGDCRFRIRGDMVNYQVDGGGDWNHPVWDWTAPGEFVATHFRGVGFWSIIGHRIAGWFGFSKFIVHKIHHARPLNDPSGLNAPHRAVVWCLPNYSYWGHSWLPTDISHRTLKHIVYSDSARPGWNRLVFNTDEGVMVSFGRQNDDACVTMKKEMFDVLMGCASAQSVTSRLLAMDPEKRYSSADMALTTQYYTGSKTIAESNYVTYIANPADVPVHWVPTTNADVPDTTMRKYSKPLVSQPALAPMIRRWETLCHTLEKRVHYSLNKTKPKLNSLSLCQEFVELLIPVPHVGHPLSVEETIELLDKPRQRQQVASVMDTMDVPTRALIDAFIKNEATMKTPRLISAWADIRWIIEVSSFQYSMKQNILMDEANAHWFYPGKTPVEIARDLCAYVESVGGNVAETDYSNMDGMTSQALQEMVAFAAELRYFDPKYHGTIKKYHSNLVKSPARSKSFGFKYEAGPGVKSGSPTTTNHNTIHSGFHEYCAIRRCYPDLTPLECFLLLGPKAGDDGVTRVELASCLEKIVASWGMKLKVEKCQPETGVTFLARVFPDPLVTTTSFQDPLRTLRKLHMTTRDPKIPLADAALDRTSGYLVSDPHTPIISDYCQMIQRFYASSASSLETRKKRKCARLEQNYWSRHEVDCWPQNPQDYEMMLECVSSRIGIDTADIRAYIMRLRASNASPWQILPLGVDDTSPYDETLDDDCQLGRDWMDNRFNSKQSNDFDHERNVRVATESAASGRVVSLAQRDGDGSSKRATPGNARRETEQGSRRPSQVPDQNIGQRNKRRKGTDHQAQLPTGNPRRSGSRNRRSSTSGQNPPGPTRSANQQRQNTPSAQSRNNRQQPTPT